MHKSGISRLSKPPTANRQPPTVDRKPLTLITAAESHRTSSYTHKYNVHEHVHIHTYVVIVYGIYSSHVSHFEMRQKAKCAKSQTKLHFTHTVAMRRKHPHLQPFFHATTRILCNNISYILACNGNLENL